MRRFTKRDREMAARFCSTRACHWGMWGILGSAGGPVDDEMRHAFGERASDLAGEALNRAPADSSVPVCDDLRLAWAEAEALIRSGWLP